MGPFKGPRPNGFQAVSFQKYLVGGNLCDVAVKVLRGQVLPEGLNKTFLALLSKVDNPQN